MLGWDSGRKVSPSLWVSICCNGKLFQLPTQCAHLFLINLKNQGRASISKVGGGGAAWLQPPSPHTNVNLKIDFFKRYDVKHLWFTLQPKLDTEIG
jgi:hypothetical protein